jgi:S-DNA-T family DNA segregation ATPase FtsK/SpoIIIE
VEKIVKFLKSQGTPEYVDAVTEEGEEAAVEGDAGYPGEGSGSGDELYDQAVAVVLRDKKVSTSYIQRRLQVGYNKAASLIERMGERGAHLGRQRDGKTRDPGSRRQHPRLNLSPPKISRFVAYQ